MGAETRIRHRGGRGNSQGWLTFAGIAGFAVLVLARLAINGAPRRAGPESSPNPSPGVQDASKHADDFQAWNELRTATVAGVLSALLTTVLILVGSLYLAVIGENAGGVILRDVAPQVQLVPSVIFGTLPGTRSGASLEKSGLLWAHRHGYVVCKEDQIDEKRYRFQAIVCLKSSSPDQLSAYQSALFFYDGQHLGEDGSVPSFQARIIDRSADAITVEYTIYHWNDAANRFESTYGTQLVSYRLANQKDVMIPQAPIPPVATKFRDGR